MKFIENHIIIMMDIWGGVDAIRHTRRPSSTIGKATPGC